MLLQIENGVGLSLSSGELVTIAGPHVLLLNPQISTFAIAPMPFQSPFLIQKESSRSEPSEPLLLVSTG